MSTEQNDSTGAPRRILDVTLAEQLDMDAETLRRMIAEHRPFLETLGPLVERPGLDLPGLGKGRPFTLLTEAQAGFLVIQRQREEQPVVSPSLEEEFRLSRAVTHQLAR